eukprot:scaffold307903_cov26-Tisochrysis_lutea.AAC.1
MKQEKACAHSCMHDLQQKHDGHAPASYAHQARSHFSAWQLVAASERRKIAWEHQRSKGTVMLNAECMGASRSRQGGFTVKENCDNEWASLKQPIDGTPRIQHKALCPEAGCDQWQAKCSKVYLTHRSCFAGKIQQHYAVSGQLLLRMPLP